MARLEREVSEKVSTGTVRQVLSLLNVAVEHDWVMSAPKIRLPRAEDNECAWLRSEDEMRRLLDSAAKVDYPGLWACQPALAPP